jgi:leucyl aminopeptidase
MELVFEKEFKARAAADALVIPFWKKEGAVENAAIYTDYHESLYPIIDLGDFTAKEQEVCLVYNMQHPEQRLILVGLGNEHSSTLESIRRSFAEAIKLSIAKKLKTLNLLLPLHSEFSPSELAQVIGECALLTNYRFDYKSAKQDQTASLLEKVCIMGEVGNASVISKEIKALVKGVNFTRDLVNGNADEVTPKVLAGHASDLEKTYSTIKVKILDKDKIQKEGLGLFYAVAKGASTDPYFIVINYEGQPSSEENTVLIGKGITYDTGGLSLKPTAGMETMRCDMAGAAAVLGTLIVAAEMKLPLNLSCVIAATENAISAQSYKIGDVYKAYNQMTVEIKNTDAEGRLALADSLAYAMKHLKPTRMIDLATLTGAAEVALGNYRSPLFSNHEALAEALFQAGEETGERVWLMPLDPDYKELISSKIADMKNSGAREGSLIFSAMFLKEFVGNIPWAHIDIAGTAFLEKPRHYHTTSATGYGIRLLIHYLKTLYVNK